MLQQQLSHRGWAAGEVFDHRIDRVIAQLCEEARFPVVQRTFWVAVVKHAVQLAIRQRAERIHDRKPELLERPHCRLALRKRPTVAGYHRRQFGT